MNQDQLIREIQERYRVLDRTLNERQRRLWAATEALNRGRGGIALVSRALRISPNTIKKGMQEIRSGLGDAAPPPSRIRKPGGGRKSQRICLDRTTHPHSPSEEASVGPSRSEETGDVDQDSIVPSSGTQPLNVSQDVRTADGTTARDQ